MGRLDFGLGPLQAAKPHPPVSAILADSVGQLGLVQNLSDPPHRNGGLGLKSGLIQGGLITSA